MLNTKEKIKQLEASISELNAQLREIRNSCEHKSVMYRSDSNTGNYDSTDEYWKVVVCLDCGHRMRFDSKKDKDNYYLRGIIGSELKVTETEFEILNRHSKI